jgi:hypothetical protein
MSPRRNRMSKLSVESLESRMLPVVGLAASAPVIALGQNGGEADGVVMLTVTLPPHVNGGTGIGTGSIMSTATHVLTAAHIIGHGGPPGGPPLLLLPTAIDFEAMRGGFPVPVTAGVVPVLGRIQIQVQGGSDFLSTAPAWSPVNWESNDIGIV